MFSRPVDKELTPGILCEIGDQETIKTCWALHLWNFLTEVFQEEIIMCEWPILHVFAVVFKSLVAYITFFLSLRQLLALCPYFIKSIRIPFSLLECEEGVTDQYIVKCVRLPIVLPQLLILTAVLRFSVNTRLINQCHFLKFI